jgi:hypothetical protein
MKKRNISVILCTLAVLLIIISGCSAAGTAASASTASLKITGMPGGDITVNMSDVQSLKTYEGKVEGADSAGKPVIYNIKGGYFSDLLQKNGYSQPDFSGIRIVATDGYSIEVSQDILKNRDIIIAYEMDGKPLDKDNAPYRVFIPNERAMYWVRMVSEIDVLSEVDSGAVSGIYIMESLYTSADYQDYEFTGQSYKALDTKKIISDHPGTKGNVVLMTAADGLLKNETLENFYKGAINMTGTGSPEFLSSTLPEGMFVKNLVVIKYGGNAFYFAVSENAKSLDALAQTCGLSAAEKYTLSFADGTTQTIGSSDLPDWIFGMMDGKVFVQNNGAEQQYFDLISINNN